MARYDLSEAEWRLEVTPVPAPDRQLHHPGPPARRRWKKGGPDHAIGRSRGGLSTKINALVDQDGLPLRIVLSAGQASDKAAVAELIDGLPPAKALVADRGYDAQAVIESRPRARRLRSHPHAEGPQGPALHRPGDLPPAQPGRALLLQAQALQTGRNALRQTRKELPGSRLARINPVVAQSL
ncbi:hypothetical protein QE389_001164 [Brevundimonas sp. SORGH_AS 993]|nr:transposase [Brevundimonas sp. SORGH_AS_0993]MDQ1153965.1 hypothetical protein [Brevundimonas sp. SORGH_AS_0993]